MMMRTRELQKDDMVIFFFWCLRKVRFPKNAVLKDGVQTVDIKFDVQNTNTISNNRVSPQGQPLDNLIRPFMIVKI